MRGHWDKLSDQDIDAIQGRRPQLIEVLQQRYAIDQAQAMAQADTFVRSLQVLAL
jgi:DNA polymerase III alpha subunit